MEVEHIKPKSKEGSDRVSNLTLACHCCNQKKGDKDVTVFVGDKAVLDKNLTVALEPLNDAAAA